MKYDVVERKNYKNDRVIYREGDEGDELYVILSGAVKLVKEMRSENLVIEVMRTGEVFGAMSFLSGKPRNATARTMGDTVVGLIRTEPLKEEMGRISNDLNGILNSLAKRLRIATDNSVGVTFIRREPRVLRKLSVGFEKKDNMADTFSHDVSGGGMFVKTDKPFSRGQVFLLKLSLPDDSDDMWIRSQVAWVRNITDNPEAQPIGMGVKFMGLSEDSKKRLREIIAQD